MSGRIPLPEPCAVGKHEHCLLCRREIGPNLRAGAKRMKGVVCTECLKKYTDDERDTDIDRAGGYHRWMEERCPPRS